MYTCMHLIGGKGGVTTVLMHFYIFYLTKKYVLNQYTIYIYIFLMKINIKIYYTPIPESIAKNTKENTIKQCNSSMITLTLIVILYNNEIHA